MIVVMVMMRMVMVNMMDNGDMMIVLWITCRFKRKPIMLRQVTKYFKTVSLNWNFQKQCHTFRIFDLCSVTFIDVTLP